MKNVLDERHSQNINRRLSYSALFVQDQDIKNRRVLDIGCGFGWFEINASIRGAKEIIAFEISEDNLKTAKRAIIKDGVIFQVANAIDLPFRNETFDTVVAWEIIEHIPKNNEIKLFSEVRRILKKNGVFYMSTPYRNPISVIFDPCWWIKGHRHYNYNNLFFYATENAFIPECFSIKGRWTEIFGIWDFYISKWLFRKKPFFEKIYCKKSDFDFNKEKGFTNIFIKFKAT